MKTTQSTLAEKWGVSRSLVCKYHAQGMPLDEAGAEGWLWLNIPANKIHTGIERARKAASPRSSRLSTEESMQFLAALVEMKERGAHRRKHPEHQAFCDGVRLYDDFA